MGPTEIVSTSSLIGQREEDAIDLLKEKAIQYRITSRDGKAYIITRDFMSRRYNLRIKDNIVVEAYAG